MSIAAKLIATLLFCVPVAIVLTISVLPIWRWFEEATGIESIGHSGPAIWCYIFMNVLCSLMGGWVLLKGNVKNARH